MIRQYELVERIIAYDAAADEGLLNKAYVFSLTAHGTQKRASGDPYFSHPLEVAGILTDYKLDTTTIVTALLHDTVEDTVATIEEIAEKFGPTIAKLVNGVTKLSKLELNAEADQQAENFRKLVLAMSDDIRVLLVKLADRLHNMRTLQYLDDLEKRRRIATETMDIYAPLAERLGMERIKEELEDLSFEELHSEARSSIVHRFDFLRAGSEDLVKLISSELRQVISDAGISAEVEGRQKTPFSIWRKMEKRSISFEQLSDTVAFRIIVGAISECYETLGIVHGHYSMVPDRFKDYISTPKPNDYRSIHTTVIGPRNGRIEIQIRTQEMHEIAELGVAAHWQFKQGIATGEKVAYRWLRDLQEILEQDQSPEEFLENTKLEMFQDQVFCFTPRGDLIALPSGATPVDFAYTVHTEVGDTCVGAKINGRMMPLRSKLNNGDQVEILRSKSPGPDPRWENIVVTGKARSSIKRFVRSSQKEEYQRLGKAIAEKSFRESGRQFSESALENILTTFNLYHLEDLYLRLGEGRLTSRELLDKIFPGENRWIRRGALGAINRIIPARLRRPIEKDGKAMSLPIRGLKPGLAVHYADCCHPLPGDRIVGEMADRGGVRIHTIDCEQLITSAKHSEDWLDLRWAITEKSSDHYVGRIETVVSNEPGSLSSLSSVIARNMANISNLKITDRTADFFEMLVDIEVTDLKHLTNIVAALRVTPCICSVERVRG